MKPIRSIPIAFVFACLVPLLMAQSGTVKRSSTNQTLSGTAGTSAVLSSCSSDCGGIEIASPVTTGTLSTWGGSGCFLISAGGSSFGAQPSCISGGSGVPSETRKLKTPLPTIASVRASAKFVADHDRAPASYLKLAKSVGLESPATDEAHVLDMLSLHGFKIYDYDRVDDFLYNQALHMKENTRWVWKPAREKDLKSVEGVSWRTEQGMGFVYPKQYAKKIPARVLEDMACILSDLKDAAFLVSDFEVIKPDPFMAVTTPQLLKEHKIYIFAQWDEPTFDDGLRPVSIASR